MRYAVADVCFGSLVSWSSRNTDAIIVCITWTARLPWQHERSKRMFSLHSTMAMAGTIAAASKESPTYPLLLRASKSSLATTSGAPVITAIMTSWVCAWILLWNNEYLTSTSSLEDGDKFLSTSSCFAGEESCSQSKNFGTKQLLSM